MKNKTFFVLTLMFALSLLASKSILAATITGTVKYEGEVPKFKAIAMDADPICQSHHTSEVFPQSLILGEGNTVGNILVSVTSGFPKQNYPAPTQAAFITQSGCMYDPHVLAVMVGQNVDIENPDGTLHNVHIISKENGEQNIAQPGFRKNMNVTFSKPELTPFQFKCDVHPWMGAWVAVFDHPFFSVTKSDGKFAIANLPPGKYEIQAWHEKLGTQSQTVEIAADGDTKEINFNFSRPSK